MNPFKDLPNPSPFFWSPLALPYRDPTSLEPFWSPLALPYRDPTSLKPFFGPH